MQIVDNKSVQAMLDVKVDYLEISNIDLYIKKLAIGSRLSIHDACILVNITQASVVPSEHLTTQCVSNIGPSSFTGDGGYS